jgi:hypothetical protein
VVADGENLSSVSCETSRTFRNKKEGLSERKKLMSLKKKNRTYISEIYKEAYMNLRRVNNLELTWYKMKMTIYLQIPTIF